MELIPEPQKDSGVLPYCGPPIGPDDLVHAWNLDPWLLAAITVACAIALLIRAQTGPSASRDRALLVALGGLVIAFVSPLCAATVALFSARTLHHLVLVGVVAPSLAAAWPRCALPASTSLGVTSAVLVLWHIPSVYDAAWNSVPVYWLMQAALLGPAWLFWSAILRPSQRAEVLFGYALMVGGLGGVMGLIGAVLTFAPSGLYPQHLVGVDAFGMTLLADQQLAGLIMWVPGFMPMAAIAGWMLRRGWKQGFAA